MLTAIVGEEFGYNMGNLKTYTLTLVGYLDYLQGKKIYANYKLKFPYVQLKSFKEMVEVMKTLDNVTILLDELHTILDQYTILFHSTKKKTSEWLFKEIARQSRKRNLKIYYVNQTFADTHKSIRRITHRVWLTSKLHYDYQKCYIDDCFMPHLLEINDIKSMTVKYFKVLPQVFQLYDTNEIIEWDY